MPLNVDLNAPEAPEQSTLIFKKTLTRWPLRKQFTIPSKANPHVNELIAEGEEVWIVIEDYNGDVTRKVNFRRSPDEKRGYRFGKGWKKLVKDHRMEIGGTVWVYGRQGVPNRLILHYESPPSKYLATTQAPDGRTLQAQSKRKQQKLDDGHKWQSYGTNLNKGKQILRSYYKCRRRKCKARVKVDRDMDGNITNVVYVGSHTHPEPEKSATQNGTDKDRSDDADIDK